MADLRVYLLRESITDPTKAVKTKLNATSSMGEVKIRAGAIPGEARLYWGRNKKDRPNWVSFVQDLAADGLDIGPSETRSALLFVRSNGRWFAFTFGQAWGALDDAEVEDQFGIRVALNLLDPAKVKTIDTKSWSAFPLHTTRQLTRAGPLDEFRISYLEDFVNLVEAVPVDPKVGDLVTGRDALVLKRQAKSHELPELCDTLWKAFNDNRYREVMPFLDRLRTVRERTLLRLLDDQLLAAVRSTPTVVQIGTPEIHSLEGCRGFRFVGNRATTGLRAIEPDAADYLLLHAGGQPQIEDLRKDRLEALDAGGVTAKSWPVYKCIQWDTRLDDTAYVLNEGKWYEVSDKFQSELDEKLASYVCAKPKLPDATSFEIERDYNLRAAKHLDAACVDGHLMVLGGAKDKVEPCDVFTLSRDLIHVKFYRGSANTSHMLSQGVVSARVLREEAGVKQFKSLLKAKCKRDDHAELLVHPLKTKEFRVVYGLIVPKGFEFPTGLPIFTKINAEKHFETLEGMGYKVCLTPIWQT